jgi:hypothetical protein
MSNLLNDAEGRAVVLRAQKWLLESRLSRFFKRNIVIDYSQWSLGGDFDLATTLGALNPAHDDELRDLYRLLGTIGALPQSIADTTVYINPTTGSDVTGTGSATTPYASLWFLPFLPKRIDHLYRILIYGDLDHGAELTITNEIGDNGCLSFVGIGAAVEVFSAVASSVSVITDFQNTWRMIDTVTPPVAGCAKSFIRMTSGTNNNYAAPVVKVDPANSHIFFRRDPLNSVAAPDTFQYVEPAQTLTVRGLTIDCNGSHKVNGGLLGWRAGRVVFHNLKISIDYQGLSVGNVMTTRGVPVVFAFCQLEAAGQSSTFPVEIYNSFNEYKPVDTGLLTVSGCGITNVFQGDGGSPTSCGLQSISPFSDEHGYNDRVLQIGSGAVIHAFDCMAYVRATGSNTIRRMSAKQWDFTSANSNTDYLGADPKSTTPSAFNMDHSIVYFGHGLVGECRNAFEVFDSRVYFFAGGGDDASGALTAISLYAIDMVGQTKFYFRNAWTGPSGLVNDIIFNDPAAPVASAFPAANSLVTDNLGNDCSRRS